MTLQNTATALPSAQDWSETELLSRMLLRDGNAWREFHRRYDRLIFRCIHKVTGRFQGSITSEDVREIYGMFLLSLNKRDMHKLRTFEPERGNKLSSWVGMLATNCAWDYLRRVARQPQCTTLADAEHLGSFSKKDRVFVRLYYVDGLTPEEVAERMSISVKTVYSKKHKIRCRIQKALEPGMTAAA